MAVGIEFFRRKLVTSLLIYVLNIDFRDSFELVPYKHIPLIYVLSKREGKKNNAYPCKPCYSLCKEGFFFFFSRIFITWA